MACCYKCMRYLVFVFNFLYWLIGLSIVAIAIWLRVDNRVQDEIKAVEFEINIAVYVMLGIGVVMTVLGFLGCCGAYQESKCLLGTFFACLLIIFLAEVGGGVLIYLKRSEARDFVGKAFQQFTTQYLAKNSTTIRFYVDSIQNTFECCAAMNNSFEYGTYLNMYKELPESCCIRQKPCIQNIANEDCVSKLEKLAGKYWVPLVAGAAVLLFMELLGMIFSMSLCCYLRYKKHRDEYEEEEPFETEHLMF